MDSHAGSEVNLEKEPEESASQLRKSARVRTLTEKGKEMQDEKVKGHQRFDYIFEKWRSRAKSAIVTDRAFVRRPAS